MRFSNPLDTPTTMLFTRVLWGAARRKAEQGFAGCGARGASGCRSHRQSPCWEMPRRSSTSLISLSVPSACDGSATTMSPRASLNYSAWGALPRRTCSSFTSGEIVCSRVPLGPCAGGPRGLRRPARPTTASAGEPPHLDAHVVALQGHGHVLGQRHGSPANARVLGHHHELATARHRWPEGLNA